MDAICYILGQIDSQQVSGGKAKHCIFRKARVIITASIRKIRETGGISAADRRQTGKHNNYYFS